MAKIDEVSEKNQIPEGDPSEHALEFLKEADRLSLKVKGKVAVLAVIGLIAVIVLMRFADRILG